jgi:DNA ligase (NAD+)
MDIEGFGSETVNFLVQRGLVHEIPDLYWVDYGSLVGEPGFGDKKASALARAVESSKSKPFRTVLVSLGIPDFGKKAVDLLLRSGIRSAERLLSLVDADDRDPVLAIKGFGEKTVDSLFSWLSQDRNRRVIERLGEAGLQLSEKEEHQSSSIPQVFAGQTWCVTGSFERFVPRSLALKEIEIRGGRTTGSVTKKTTHLLAGSSAGSKLQQAITLGTTIIDEGRFIDLLEGGNDEV